MKKGEDPLASGEGDTKTETKKGTTDDLKTKNKVESQPGKDNNTGLEKVQILIALLFLLAGILTPPFWESLRQLKISSSMATPELSAAQLALQCNETRLQDYLHEIAVPGMHVVCFGKDSLVFYKDAMHTTTPRTINAKIVRDWSSLRNILFAELLLKKTDELHQPWSTFAANGDRLLSETDPGNTPIQTLKDEGIFLVFQGGQWIWPGVRKGFQREINLHDGNKATLETLSLHPLVLSVGGFLSQDECDWIKQKAELKVQYSEVTLMDKDQGRPSSDFRTSQSTFLGSHDPQMKKVDDRTASLVRIDVSHQEHVQVLRYGEGEKYNTHLDYFDPELYQADDSTQELIQNGRRNRMATVFWYLSDVEEGGETAFPRMDKAPEPTATGACEQGLLVKPERGKVIIFYSMTPDGKLDPYSLHAACPVKKGIKWAANKWVWNAPFPWR